MIENQNISSDVSVTEKVDCGGNDVVLTEEENTSRSDAPIFENFEEVAANAVEITIMDHGMGGHSSYICEDTDVHWYKFTVPQNQNTKYTIYTTGSLDTIGQLYDSKGNVIDNVDNREECGKLNFRMIQDLTANETYYVRVTVAQENLGSYTLYVSRNLLIDYLKITPETICLKVGETYELPCTLDCNYLNLKGMQEIDNFVVSSVPDNPYRKDLMWNILDSSMFSIIHEASGDDVYQAVRTQKCGYGKLYVNDSRNQGKGTFVNVIVTSEGGEIVRAIAKNGLPLRKDASDSSVLLGMIENMTEIALVNATPQNGTWYQVYAKLPDDSWSYGWCSGEYLGKFAEYAYLKSTDNWFVRSGAGRGFSDIGLIISGSVVKCLERGTETIDEYIWHKILYNNQEGYVADRKDDDGTYQNYKFIDHWEAIVGGVPPYIPEKASSDCRNFIKNYEVFSSTPYNDGYGNLTIGYGHTIKEGEFFTTISDAEALELFDKDISEAEKYISNCLKNRNKIFNQQQLDAFVSLSFNVGTDAADVLEDIIADKDPYETFSKLSRASDGSFSLGLYRRRMDEADIYVKGDYIRQDRNLPN